MFCVCFLDPDGHFPCHGLALDGMPDEVRWFVSGFVHARHDINSHVMLRCTKARRSKHVRSLISMF